MTPNHNYSTPDAGTLDWHLPLNDNFEKLDTKTEIRDVEANRGQYTPKNGAKFLATDTGTRYLGDGSQWVEAPPQQPSELIVPRMSSDPSDLTDGQIWYRSDTDELRLSLGGTVATLAEYSGSDTTTDEPTGGDAPLAQSGLDTAEEVENFWDMKWKQSDRWDVVSNPVAEGSGAEKIIIKQGTQGGVTQHRYIYGQHGTFNNTFPTEAHNRFWLYLDPSWPSAVGEMGHDFSGGNGGKMGVGFDGTHGTGDGFGGSPSDGTNGWTARVGFWAGDSPYANAGSSDYVHPTYYVYHADMSGKYGSSWHWNKDIKKGEWTQVDLYCKLNTDRNRDGELWAWLDGEEVFKRTDIRFAWESPFNTLYAAKNGWFWGGGWEAPADAIAYVDNVQLWDSKQL
jgi:hypothetical protein